MSKLARHQLGGSGVTITETGLGGVPLGGFKAKLRFEEALEIVKTAYDGGVRYFDTAPLYGFGKAEYMLGHALRELGIRDEVVVSTKVARVLKPRSRTKAITDVYGIDWIEPLPFLDTYDYTYDGFMRSFEDSQQRLALDFIDVLYVHDLGKAWHGDDAGIYWKQFRDSGFKALDELRSSGAVKAIGLGVNETQSVLEVAREFPIDCSMIAGRYSLLNHAPLDGAFDELLERNVSVAAAGVFNSGVLASGMKAHDATYDYGKVPEELAKRVVAIEDIAAKHDVSLPVAAIQFVGAHPAVATIVLGAGNADQVAQNVAAFDVVIPDAFWTELKQAGLLPEKAPVPGANAA